MDIQLADDLPESIEEPPPSSKLQAWAQAAWQGDANASPVLSLRIVSSSESQHLNYEYRGKNKPTNVLSFPMHIEEELSQLAHEGEEPFLLPAELLGDLAICAEVVDREAQQQAKPREAHWAHMVVHGMLHLQGFDHIEQEQARQMEQLETQIMLQLGFADPYQLTSIESSMTEFKS